MLKPRNKRITEEEKDKAIEAYAIYGTITKAAEQAGVSRWTLWHEMKRSAIFKKQMEEVKASYVDELEAILDKRIKDGDDKASAILLMFKLKQMCPEYREKYEHRVDGDIRIISGVPRPQDK